jgi:hypothetical protein
LLGEFLGLDADFLVLLRQVPRLGFEFGVLGENAGALRLETLAEGDERKHDGRRR